MKVIITAILLVASIATGASQEITGTIGIDTSITKDAVIAKFSRSSEFILLKADKVDTDVGSKVGFRRNLDANSNAINLILDQMAIDDCEKVKDFIRVKPLAGWMSGGFHGIYSVRIYEEINYFNIGSILEILELRRIHFSKRSDFVSFRMDNNSKEINRIIDYLIEQNQN